MLISAGAALASRAVFIEEVDVFRARVLQIVATRPALEGADAESTLEAPGLPPLDDRVSAALDIFDRVSRARHPNPLVESMSTLSWPGVAV